MLTDRTASDLAVSCFKSQYMYEYIIETETPLSELKAFPMESTGSFLEIFYHIVIFQI